MQSPGVSSCDWVNTDEGGCMCASGGGGGQRSLSVICSGAARKETPHDPT